MVKAIVEFKNIEMNYEVVQNVDINFFKELISYD